MYKIMLSLILPFILHCLSSDGIFFADTMVHSRFEIAKKKYHSQLLDQPNKRRRVQGKHSIGNYLITYY